MAIDQSFHFVVLFGTALLAASHEAQPAAGQDCSCRRGVDRRESRSTWRRRGAGQPTSVDADLERKTIDARFEIRGDEEACRRTWWSSEIDDVTFQDLQQRWPFRRATHAKV